MQQQQQQQSVTPQQWPQRGDWIEANVAHWRELGPGWWPREVVQRDDDDGVKLKWDLPNHWWNLKRDREMLAPLGTHCGVEEFDKSMKEKELKKVWR